MTFKSFLKKIWSFIWYDNSLLSWVVNILLAFVLVKFVLYPGIGFVLGTDYPLVAVVSGSMHHEMSFDPWWDIYGPWYEERGITKEHFKEFSFKNGFNKGDIMILGGPQDLEVGDVIVYSGSPPIIHRLYALEKDERGTYYRTKGDHNPIADGAKIRDPPLEPFVLGKALIRIPLLGWVKILVSDFFLKIASFF